MDLASRALVFVVIPAYNEGPTISRVVADVKRAGYKVVVVDDGSSDATADHAGEAGAAVITHPFNLGQGAALQTGIDYALAQSACRTSNTSSTRSSASGPTSRSAVGFLGKHPIYLPYDA
jgi:GT2 family glycosyltransferase